MNSATRWTVIIAIVGGAIGWQTWMFQQFENRFVEKLEIIGKMVVRELDADDKQLDDLESRVRAIEKRIK